MAKLGGELGVRRRVRTKFGLGTVNGKMEVERVVWMGTGEEEDTYKKTCFLPNGLMARCVAIVPIDTRTIM